ncbi:MAG: hypothetical protein WCQ64_09340 [Acidobacteriota bacterium]
MKFLSAVAGISFFYDLTVGIVMLTATGMIATVFHAPLPAPILFAKLLGIFLICVGLGYAPAWRDPATHRVYLWIFGVVLKLGGAIAFVTDFFVNASPTSFLLFAASDGTLALLTLWGLIRLSTGSSDRPSLRRS